MSDLVVIAEISRGKKRLKNMAISGDTRKSRLGEIKKCYFSDVRNLEKGKDYCLVFFHTHQNKKPGVQFRRMTSIFYRGARPAMNGAINRIINRAQQLVVLLLVVSFIMTPLSTAFAQEAPSGDSAPAVGSAPAVDVAAGTPTSPETPATPDTSAPGTPDTPAAASDAGVTDLPVGTTDDQTAPAPETSADVVAEPTVDLPTDNAATLQDALTADKAEADVKAEELDATAKDQQMMAMSSGGGAAEVPSIEKHLPFRSDYVSGALTYTYSLQLPPGRNNLQPELSLIYNNQNADDSNPFGYGWSINIPSIRRINKNGSERMYSNAFFHSSLSGDLATTSATSTYVAKVDDGSSLRYSFANNVWTAIDKNGVRYIFGSTVAERQDDPNDSTRVYKWMLSEVRDTNNNYIKYQYYKDAGQIYPSAVIYTGNGATDGIFRVDFARSVRSDNKSLDAKTGFPVTNNYRISEISTSVGGVWVRKYALATSTSVTGHRMTLGSITESGRDSAGNTLTLPPTSFSYSVSTKGWTENSNWSMPLVIPFDTKGFYIGDINGDAIPDLVRSAYYGVNAAYNDVYINNADGTWINSTTTWTMPVSFLYSFEESGNGAGMADINGDGLPDVYRNHQGQNNVWLNTGAGWTLSSSTVPMDMDRAYYGTHVTDINGDGLTDFVRHVWYNQYLNFDDVYVNNGDGTWTNSAATWSVPVNQAADGAGMADLNGDGLIDVYQSKTDGGTINEVYLNTGHGWSLASGWHLPVSFSGNQVAGLGIRFADVNGDKLNDIVYNVWYADNNYHTNVYINNGDGTWSDEVDWNVPVWMNLQGVDFSDLNGDGLEDVFQSNDQGSNKVWMSNNRPTDYLIRVNVPEGGAYSFAYKATPQYKDASNHLINPNLPYVIQTVSEVSAADGNGTIGTTTYAYSGGTNYYASALNHQLGGFGQVVSTDPAGNVTKTFYHQGNTSDTANGEYQDTQAKIGRSYRTEQYDNASHLFSKTINKWDAVASSTAGTSLVNLAQNVAFTYDGDADHKDKAANYTYDTANGNLIQKIDWGEVTGNNDGTFTDTGSDRASTTITYVASSSVNMWLPKQETTVDQSLTKVKETKYYYDTLALGSVRKGNETKRESWITGTSYIDTEKTYNSYGLVTQEKDPRDKATNYTYDAYNLYPASTTNALSHVTGRYYDYSSGKPTTVVDPNGRTFQYVYDPVDRLIEEKQPDHTTPSTLVTKAAYTYTDTPNNKNILKTSYLDGSNTALEYTYFDGLDRVVQKRTEAEDANTFSVTDRVYNNRGLLWKESLPYFSSGSANTTPTGTSALYTTYTYDVMQRPTTIARVVGNETRAYDDWKTTITDPRGNPKSLYSDARGNLKQVDEINSGQTSTTVYDWNLLNSLTRITDAENNVRNFTYDGVGRRLTAQDLHAQADGSYGTWTYAYDASGNIATTTDPKSQVVVRTYDDLNRPLTENYTGAAGTEATFTYDTCTDGKGRICRSVFTGSATSTYLYTPLGQLKAEGKLIVGTSTVATTTYEYNRQGNTTKITTPDNAQVTYAYNTAGLLETVQRKEAADGSYTNVVTDFDYAPTGAITYTAYANGASTANTYDANELYRLRSKVTTAASSTRAQDLTYTYDGNGNITRIVDASQTTTAKTADYGYDALNRLTSASTTGATNGQNYKHTYAYSSVGNITSVGRGSSTSTYAYAQTNYANPHAATAIGVSTGGGGGTSTTTTHTLYAETLGSGWEDWSWDTTLNPSNTSPVRTGTYSLSSNHTVAWGGMYLHHAGVSTTGSTHLTFSVRSPAAGTYLELESYGSGGTLLGNVVLNDYIPGGSMSANTWYDVSIPLSALGASNTTFTGLVAMRSTTGYVYWDDMKLVNVSAGGGGSSATTTLAYDNAGNLTSMGTTTYAWNYRHMLTQSGNGVATSTYAYDTDGARLKLTEAGVTTYFPSKYYEVTGTSTTKHIFAGDLLLATVQNGGSSGGSATTTTATIYDDATTWNDWSWDTTVNLNETTTVYSGTKSLKATYTAAWGGLYLQNSAGPSTSGATHLHFAVRSSTTDPDVEIDAYGPGDTLRGYVMLDTYIPSMSANTWYVVDIPLTALNATTTTLTGFSALRGTTGVLYFDEIKLIAAGSGGGSASTTVRYVHSDHLNSTNVVTSNTGAIVQTLDYYPYGGSRVNESVGGADEKRKYIGQYVDAVSALSYLNARYYDSARGQFTSQDPVFWSGNQNLANPQSLNSYSYANGNPITMSDPNGQKASLVAALQSFVSSLKSYASSLAGSSGMTVSVAGSCKAPAPQTLNTPITLNNRTTKTTTWDSVSNERIKKLDPRVQQPAVNFINNTESELNIQLRINEGYRSIERQNELYNQSRTIPPTGPWVTNAMGGQSYHNYGMAIDTVIMENGKPNWNKPITPDIASIGEREGFEWGGRWNAPITDRPHFQMTFGQSWQDLLKASTQ